MRILSIDPGNTCGIVVLDNRYVDTAPVLLDHWEEPGDPIGEFALEFIFALRRWEITHVIVEEFRVFASKAKVLIGNPLLAAKLVGAITALCAITVPPVSCTLIEPIKKGRWPDARLAVKFPAAKGVVSEHELDALKLALACLEATKLWKVK